jgi:hypothetical protein
MKKTILTIVATALLTWTASSVAYSVHRGVERLWLVSAVKVPGKMAIAEIQTDMNAGRYDLAKAKLQAFSVTWERFNNGPDSFSGRGIGDIMLTFSKIETNRP